MTSKRVCRCRRNAGASFGTGMHQRGQEQREGHTDEGRVHLQPSTHRAREARWEGQPCQGPRLCTQLRHQPAVAVRLELLHKQQSAPCLTPDPVGGRCCLFQHEHAQGVRTQQMHEHLMLCAGGFRFVGCSECMLLAKDREGASAGAVYDDRGSLAWAARHLDELGCACCAQWCGRRCCQISDTARCLCCSWHPACVSGLQEKSDAVHSSHVLVSTYASQHRNRCHKSR